LIETGASVDIWGDNIMVDENENFVLIDPGSPSELERHLSDLHQLPKEMRSLLATNLLKRVNDLSKYPSTIEMTSEEIQLMNVEFGFTQDQYEQASSRLVNTCESLSS
jgi:hypothetical protein